MRAGNASVYPGGTSLKRLLIILAVLIMSAAACDVGDLILSPKDGTIVPEDTVEVTGKIPTSAALGGTLRVNGVVVPVNPDRTWTAFVPQSATGYTTDIHAVYTDPSGIPWRQRQAVVHGPKVDEGQFSPDGVGMRFTNTGLDNLGPVIQDLAGNAFDISGLLLSQVPLFEQENAFLFVDVVGTAYEGGLGGVDIEASSTATGVNTHITVKDLYIGLTLNINDGLFNPTCRLELQIPTTTIDAKFDLKPSAADPSYVDVNMIGAPTVNTGTVGYEFISGICDSDVFLIGDIVNALAGSQIPSLVSGAFASQLGDPDGAGPADSPIADAIETALSQISIAGAVGEATKVNLRAPFTQINETADAIDFRSNADFFATFGSGPTDCPAVARAPDLASTFDVPGPYPSLGATTPNGDPYGLGLVVSGSAFNQLLGAMTECGKINQDITSISLGGPPVPLTSSLLAVLAPEFGTKLPANTPMKIRVVPTVSPFLTSSAGPNGEPAELMLANLRLQFIETRAVGAGFTDLIHLELAVDAPLGFDLQFDPVAGALAPVITPPPGSAVKARVLRNALNTSEPTMEAFFPSIFPSFVGGLSDTFAAFPLPGFLGLKLNVVDVARDGNYFVLYGNLDPVLKTRIENVAVTDLSSGDSADDDLISDSNEWRHRIRKKISSTQVKVDLKGMLGVDACCTFDSENRTAHAGLRVTMNVVPENGQTWKLDVSHLIAGAHTLIDDSSFGCKAESKFTSPINGKAKIGNGAFQNFNFNPTDTGASGENTVNEAFTGSGATFLQGTTAETITVEFGFDMEAKSTSQGFPPCGGNEAALRLGANDTLANGFTAGEYPGQGNRNILNDGHKSTIQLTTLP